VELQGEKLGNGSDRDAQAGCATIPAAIDSAARGDTVCRRRFQRGSVFKNRAGTVWLGMFTEYVLDSNGVERRKRHQIALGPVRKPDGSEMRKREAQRLLQPYVDRANASLAEAARQHRSITFDGFAEIWKRDYLSLSKPSTQCSMRGQVKRLAAAFGLREMRSIGAGDLQRLIAATEAEGLEPKTIRNLWATVRLVWDAALAQGYVDRLLPKPKLPRAARKAPRYFRLEDAAKIIAHSSGEYRVLYWLAAETGLRAGELVGLRLADIEADRIRVSQSVWHGRVQTPKTGTAIRSAAVSPQLAAMLGEQVERQRAKGHDFLFTASTGSPLDASLFRQRKLRPMLRKLRISEAGFHAFRHFNASLLSSLGVPLKVIQERLGHASTGSLTLDIYTHTEWQENVEAAKRAGERIEKAVDSVSLTAIQEEGLPVSEPEALVSV
jgi:integrase